MKVAGKWTYLYRAVDQHGQVIDVLLSARRDLAAARHFFTGALRAGTIPVEPASPGQVVVFPVRVAFAEDRGARPSCSRSLAMASITAVFVGAGHPPADPLAVGVKTQVDRASLASCAVPVELGVSALVAVPVLEGRPARCWHARNPTPRAAPVGPL